MASSKTNSTTVGSSQSYQNTSTNGGSHSETSSHSEGGSHSVTKGYSDSTSASQGGASSTSAGKTYASGQIAEKTQQGFDKATQEYVQSDAVANAYNSLQAAANNRPTFQSTYADKLENLYNQIMNRDKFSYNFNEDSMYQLYKDQFQNAGKSAMQDTMGQAAALTGGYGSSYSQSAGQQTYQNYLQELNNMIPQLRQQAYEEYQAEGQDLLNKYNLTNNAYNNEYGQYRDAVGDWQNDRSFNQAAYSDERNFDYSKYTGDRNFWQNEYWQEKNSEQSNLSQTEQSNWNQSQSHTDNYSETNSTFWENTNSSTDSTNWSNSTTNGWSNNIQNNWGTSVGSGSGGSGSGSGASTKWSANTNLITTQDRNDMVSDLTETYRDKGMKGLTEDMQRYYNDGLERNGTKITFDANDIASLWKSVVSEMNGNNNERITAEEAKKLFKL